MNKNIVYSLLIAASAFSFTGCSSFLEESPEDQMPDSEAYKDAQLLYLNTVATLYTRVGADYGGGGLQGTDRGIYDLNTFSSDEAVLPTRGGDWYDGGLWQNVFKHEWGTANDLVVGSWAYLYEVIGMANQSLGKLEDLQAADPENQNFAIYIAEVRSFRALYYYYLVDLFARVPIMESADVMMADVKQSERSEVFKFIWKELQEVAPQLSAANSARTGEYYGRMTKAVAYTVMCKLALNAEVYMNDHWADGPGPDGKTIMLDVEGQQMNCWKAVQHYAGLIGEMGYSLKDGIKGFSENFSIANENSSENIFTLPMDPILYPKNHYMYQVRTRHYEHGKAFNNQDGWNGASATKEALNIFEFGLNSQDPRFEATYFGGAVLGPNGEPVMNGTVPLVYAPNDIALDVSNIPNEKTAGARMAKYETDPTAESGGKTQHNDVVIFRYADVLLMKAEAMVRNGEDGTVPFNEVRNRVKAAARPCTLDNILNERELELAWEGHRRQDLVRFGKFTKAISDRPATGLFTTVFPIHENVLALNVNFTQNKGY